MSAPGPILREIHRYQRNIKDLQARIDQGPRLLQYQKKRRAREEEFVDKEKATIKALKVTIHEKEVSMQSNKQLLKRFQKQFEEAAGQKEYDALRTEIDMTLAKNVQLEEEILEHMEEVESRTARLPELEQAAAKVCKEVEEFERKHQDRINDCTQQLEEARKNLAEVEASLPPDAKEQYARLVKVHGDDALGGVEGSNCAACYTSITAQNQSDLMRGKFMLCKSCGRMLYWAE